MKYSLQHCSDALAQAYLDYEARREGLYQEQEAWIAEHRQRYEAGKIALTRFHWDVAARRRDDWRKLDMMRDPIRDLEAANARRIKRGIKNMPYEQWLLELHHAQRTMCANHSGWRHAKVAFDLLKQHKEHWARKRREWEERILRRQEDDRMLAIDLRQPYARSPIIVESPGLVVHLPIGTILSLPTFDPLFDLGLTDDLHQPDPEDL